MAKRRIKKYFVDVQGIFEAVDLYDRISKKDKVNYSVDMFIDTVGEERILRLSVLDWKRDEEKQIDYVQAEFEYWAVEIPPVPDTRLFGHDELKEILLENYFNDRPQIEKNNFLFMYKQLYNESEFLGFNVV